MVIPDVSSLVRQENAIHVPNAAPQRENASTFRFADDFIRQNFSQTFAIRYNLYSQVHDFPVRGLFNAGAVLVPAFFQFDQFLYAVQQQDRLSSLMYRGLTRLIERFLAADSKATSFTVSSRSADMSYLCGEVKAYDATRQVVTIAFSEQWPVKPTSAVLAELSLADCRAIGQEADAHEAGLTEDEECVLKMLLDEGGAIDDMLARPELLVGRVSEIGE